MSTKTIPSLGFIGGTGPEGLGLAVRFAATGHEIFIGSRDSNRGQEAAKKILDKIPHAVAVGKSNIDAVLEADIIVNTVPYSGQRSTLEELVVGIGSKILVNTVVPLDFSNGQIKTVHVEEGSAAQQAQLICTNATVVGAFHTLSAHELMDLDHKVPSDVITVSDDSNAKQLVMSLANEISGARGLDGGQLNNASYVEGLTALLLNINRTYKVRSSIKIVGI